MTASQLSSVHALPSSQLGGVLPTQLPRLQTSTVVHALLSLQGRITPPVHTPATQLSLAVQVLPSSHAPPLTGVCWHWPPEVAPQVSAVQGLPSSQLGAGPPKQLPPLQVSAVVQALPSSQGLVLLAWTQPDVELQLSGLQGLPSSQLAAGPPTQLPPLQVMAESRRSLSKLSA